MEWREIMADAASQAKSDRLKAALRENLKRRKAQARGRDATQSSDRSGASEPDDTAKRRAE
jgi:hypothetical protein